jgi:hypothetical protein
MAKRKKAPAKAKPMRSQKRVVAKEPPPYPTSREDAEREFKQLRDALARGERARFEESAAKSRKDEQFAEAKRIAERLRKYVEVADIEPPVNTGTLAFAEGFYALVESTRDSAFLTEDAPAFVAEARKRGVFSLFVRVKEEPDLKNFLLGDNRLAASKFTSAKIERERAVEIRPGSTKATLRYVLNEREPEWEIEFPRK